MEEISWFWRAAAWGFLCELVCGVNVCFLFIFSLIYKQIGIMRQYLLKESRVIILQQKKDLNNTQL